MARAPVQSGIRINATWLAKSAANITEPLFVGYRTKIVGTPDTLVRGGEEGPELWLAATGCGGQAAGGRRRRCWAGGGRG